MPRVRFLRDFRGVATAEQFFEAGAVVELPEHLAALCLAESAAVYVEPPAVSAPVTTPTVTGAAPTLAVVTAVIEDVINPVIEEAAKAKPSRKRASKKAAKP